MTPRSDTHRVRNDAIRCSIGIAVVLSPFLALLTFVLFVTFLFRGMPATGCTVKRERPLASPNRAYAAQLVNEDCSIGFGGDSVTWTIVVESRVDPSDRSDVFAADDFGDASRPVVHWIGNEHLQIDAASSLHNGLTKTSSDDGRVSVTYVYRISPTPETIAKIHAFCASSEQDRLELTSWRGEKRPGMYLFRHQDCGSW